MEKKKKKIGVLPLFKIFAERGVTGVTGPPVSIAAHPPGEGEGRGPGVNFRKRWHGSGLDVVSLLRRGISHHSDTFVCLVLGESFGGAGGGERQWKRSELYMHK